MSAFWSRRGSSPRRRSGPGGRGSWGRGDWRKRRGGSRGTASAGTNASTSWTRLSRNSHERRRAMNARIENRSGPVKNRTTVERKSDREVVVTRTVNGPARIVFEAFTKAELLERWWVPRSMGMNLLSCEVDARVGGKYRLVFDHVPEPVAFFGTYVEVKPYSRLAWTNDEGGDGGSVTTVTFEEKGGKTLVVLRESYPSKEALDAAVTGAADAMVETFDQLDELLVALGESSGQ